MLGAVECGWQGPISTSPLRYGHATGIAHASMPRPYHRPMSEIQITCAGSATFDVLAKAAGPLPIGVLGLVDTFSTAAGGPALRTGRVLAGMGIETRLIIPVGDDVFGRSLRETVPAPHLQVEFVASDQPTSTSLVAVDQDGERTMLHNIGADGAITAETIEPRMESDFLHVGGALIMPGLDDPDGAPLARLFERAKARGMHTSLDVVHDSTARWGRVLAALPYTDLFIPSVPEAEGITGIAEPAAAAERLHRLGVRFAIVTDGPHGAWVHHDDFIGHVPAFRVDTIDTTGAGDSFTGGVLTALIHGFGAEDAARMGAALGALCTTTIDTFSGPADPGDAWRMAGLEPPR